MAQPHYGVPEAHIGVPDVDQARFAANIQGEGYGVLGDDKNMTFNPSPPSPPMYSEPAPVEVHPQRKDPLPAGKPSPVSAGYKPFEAMPKAVGAIVPPATGYGNVGTKQDDVATAGPPPSGHGGQPDNVTKLKDVKGYTSLGIEESQGSGNSVGRLSEEGSNSGKERAGTAAHESMAKELEDYPAGGGFVAYIPPSKKDFIDSPMGDTDDMRGKEGAPQGFQGAPQGVPRNTDRQQEGIGGAPQESFEDVPREQEERYGAPQEGVGMNKDESGGGALAYIPPSKKDFLDSPVGDTDEMRGKEGAPQEFPRNADRQQEGVGGGPQESFVDPPQEQKERYGAPQEAVGATKDESGGAAIAYIPSSKKDFVDLPAKDTDERRGKEGAPQGFQGAPQGVPRNADQQQEGIGGGPRESFEDTPQEQEERYGALQEAVGMNKDEAGGGALAYIPPSEKDFMDSPVGDTDEMRGKEGAPQGFSRNEDRQQEGIGGGPQESFADPPQKQEERYGAPQEAVGATKDESGGGAIAYIPSSKKDFVDFPAKDTDEMRGKEGAPEGLPRKADWQQEGIGGGPQGSFEDAPQEQEERYGAPREAVGMNKDESGGGALAYIPSSKKDFVDSPAGDVDDMRGKEGAPQGFPRNAEQQQDDTEGGPQRSFKDAPQEQEERYSAPQEAVGINKDESADRKGGAPRQTAMAEGPEGGPATGSRDINDLQSLKGEPVGVPETGSQEPSVIDDSMEGDIKDEPKAFDPTSAPSHEPEVESAPGSRGIHDVQPLKVDYGDLPVFPVTKERVPADDSIDSSIADEPNPQQSAIAKDAPGKVSGFDTEEKEQARDFDVSKEHGEPFAEHADPAVEQDAGYKPDVRGGAADVIGDEHEKPTHEAEADVAAKPYEEDLNARSEALTGAVEGMKDHVPKARGLDKQGYEQAGDSDAREDHDEHAEPFTQRVSSAAVPEQDVGLKPDDKDVDTSDVSTRGEFESVPAEKKDLKFPEAGLEKDEFSEADAKPEPVLDDAKQSEQPEARPTGDNIDGCETFQGDDGREKIKAGGYNIYSGEPEKTVYDAADVIGDRPEKLPLEPEETKGDAPMKPSEDAETKEKAVPGVGLTGEDVHKGGIRFDIHGTEQARDLGTSKEYDEHVEPATEVVSPAMEQDAAFKPGARDMDVKNASMGEDVRADKKSPYTDVFKIESSEAQQGLGLEPNLKDREDKEHGEHVEPATQQVSPAMEQDAGIKPDARDVGVEDARMREDVPAGKKSPFTDVFKIESSETQPGLGLEPNLRDREDKEHDEPVEPATQQVSPAMEQDAAFKPDAKDMDVEDAGMRESVPADKKAPYTDVFKIESSKMQQGLGLEPNLGDREEYTPAGTPNKEVYAADRQTGESGPAGEEVPSTEFAHPDDYVKVGHGAESFVPGLRGPSEKVDQQEERRPTDEQPDDYVKVGHGAESFVPGQKKEKYGELRSPPERVDQQEERRPTEEHPLDKTLEPDTVAEEDDRSKVEGPKRPPFLPQPQPQPGDVTKDMKNKPGGVREDEQQHHEAHEPQKKGIFAKIKEKLTPESY